MKLDMLEVVDCIEESGKAYCWDQYMANMLKYIYEKCQELGVIIRFPSLLIWIAMYHLCLVRNKDILEPSRFHMWHFKPFAMARTPLEQEESKVFLEHWFKDLKIRTTRWRVPQNI